MIRFMMAAALALALTACQGVPQAAQSPQTRKDERALYLSVIEELVHNGKPRAALAHLETFETLYGAMPQARKLRGDAWLAIGDLDAAGAQYSAIAEGPFAGSARDGLGRIHALRGEWDEAALAFRKASEIEPTNVRFLNDLGCALYQTRRYEEAEFALRKARELAPGDDEVADNLVALLARTAQGDRFGDVFADVPAGERRAALVARLAALARDAEKGLDP